MTVKRTLLPILWALLSHASADAAETLLHFESQAGDFIGLGQTVTLTLNEVDFLVQRNADNGVSFSITNLNRPMPPQSIWWYADFAGPFDAALAIGPYEYATRFPFQIPGAPGLSFFGAGRGCNTLTGRFDVREAAYNPVTDRGTSPLTVICLGSNSRCDSSDEQELAVHSGTTAVSAESPSASTSCSGEAVVIERTR